MSSLECMRTVIKAQNKKESTFVLPAGNSVATSIFNFCITENTEGYNQVTVLERTRDVHYKIECIK